MENPHLHRYQYNTNDNSISGGYNNNNNNNQHNSNNLNGNEHHHHLRPITTTTSKTAPSHSLPSQNYSSSSSPNMFSSSPSSSFRNFTRTNSNSNNNNNRSSSSSVDDSNSSSPSSSSFFSSTRSYPNSPLPSHQNDSLFSHHQQQQLHNSVMLSSAVTPLEQHLLNSMNNLEMCPDVCFLVRDEKIYAHKLILARSIVFRNMFYNRNFMEFRQGFNSSNNNNNNSSASYIGHMTDDVSSMESQSSSGSDESGTIAIVGEMMASPDVGHNIMATTRNNNNNNQNNMNSSAMITIDERECSVDAFLIFLKYLYIDKIVDNITLSNVIEISNLANKYSINSLEQTCERYMSENCLTDDNIFSTFVHARLYNMKMLEMNSLRYILHNASRLLDPHNDQNRLSSFYDLSQEDIYIIVSDNSININEITLFQSIVNWGLKQCERNNLNPSVDLSNVLGDLIYTIRYPLMDQIDFVRIVRPTGVLSQSDMLDIASYYLTKDASVLNNKFVTTPRRSIRILILGGDRDERIENVRKLVEDEAKLLGVDVECIDKFNANKKMISKSKLFEYSAVLAFSNSSNFIDRVEMGNLLAEFVENNHGGLVITTFANSGGLSLKGKLAEGDLCPCVLGSSQLDFDNSEPAMVITDRTHPIVKGVDKFILGKYRCKSPFKDVPDGRNKLLAVWPDEIPAIAVRCDQIRVVILNFFAVNNELITDSWNKNQPAGARIILNSLLWSSYAI